MNHLKVLHYLLFWLKYSLTIFAMSVFAASNDQDIYVFYPVVREPYNLIMDEIVAGIVDGTNRNVISQPITNSSELEEYRSLVETSRPGSVIMLSSLAKSFLANSDQPVSIISGASLLTTTDIDDGLTGISISPDPASLFVQLLELEPEVKKISVIYHRETNGWLVDMAAEHARDLGLEFESIEATDVRDAAGHYRDILNHRDDAMHSLWLLQGDPTLDEKGLLPDILNQAWSTNCVVFSSNGQHVSRGALFSLIPDYFNMGKSLAGMSEQMLVGEVVPPRAVSDLNKALNTRTAEHLNLRLSRSQIREYDLVFPSL